MMITTTVSSDDIFVLVVRKCGVAQLEVEGGQLNGRVVVVSSKPYGNISILFSQKC